MPTILDKPLSWNNIKDLIEMNNFEKFGRKNSVNQAYQEDKIRVNKIYASTRDMILINHLNFTPVSTKNNMISVSIIQEKKCDKLLCLNTFPYYVEKDISHKVLWSLEELNNDKIIKYLNKTLDKNIEYVFFRNPPHLRSIPDIFHIHIFCKLSK